jgi:uncharacterized membrane protein YqaE (UPF0057 family)
MNTSKVLRLGLAVILPPVAVLDKGCGAVVLVTILTIAGWVPGILLAALMILTEESTSTMRPGRSNGRYVTVPALDSDGLEDELPKEKAKRKAALIRLADGETAEVVEPEEGGQPFFLDKRKRGGE